jgi:hypothetical protein
VLYFDLTFCTHFAATSSEALMCLSFHATKSKFGSFSGVAECFPIPS